MSTHRGTFTCTATSTLGSDSAEIVVNVQGAPLTNVLPVFTSPTTAAVTWAGPIIDSQPLSYSLKYGISDLPGRTYANGTDLFAMITGLEEFTEYEFEVRGLYVDDIVGMGVTVFAITPESGKWKKERGRE